MLCDLGLQSPGLPSREAKRFNLTEGSVLLSLFDSVMHGMIPVMT